MFLIEILVEFFADAWSGYMKKKDKAYDDNKVQKTFRVILTVLGILLIFGIFSAFFVLIERLFPNLFDVISFD